MQNISQRLYLPSLYPHSSLYLGELPVGFQISHNSETKELNVRFNINPAIFVFDLKKIIYGCESWWGFIESEDELRTITDIDIEMVYRGLRRYEHEES